MKRRAPKGGCWCNGKFYKGGQFLPRAQPTMGKAHDDDVFLATLAELSPCPQYAAAMTRHLACERYGKPTPASVLGVIDGRAYSAYKLLADRAGTEGERMKWYGLAMQRAGQVYTSV